MLYTVKTLLGQGKNISQIARQLGIDRKTVRKIRNKVKEGEVKRTTSSPLKITFKKRNVPLFFISEPFITLEATSILSQGASDLCS